MKKFDKLFENFSQKMSEIDQGYGQKHYQATLILTFNKHIGGELGEKVREIRGIENVTTVTNAGTISETPDFQKALYKVKFIVMPGVNFDNYFNGTFKRGIMRIRGVKLNQIKKVEDITPEPT